MSLQYKKYRPIKSENFDEFLKQLGVNLILRKVANKVLPTIQLIKEDEDYYSFHIVSTFKNQSLKFKPNEEFDEHTLDGRKVKTLITFEGNNMITQQNGDKLVRIERVFNDDEMTETCIVDGVIATRWFRSVE